MISRYPKSHKYIDIGTSKAKFKNNGPHGAVVHYTAGGSSEGTISHLKKIGLGYHFLIERDGSIIQCAPLTHIVYHAGKSNWCGRTALNNAFIGIALCSWGRVEQKGETFFAYPKNFGHPLPKSQYIITKWNGEWWEGPYYKQVQSLVALCHWFVSQGRSWENIIGHDECSPKRKIDPGGILNMSMSHFRNHFAPFFSEILG